VTGDDTHMARALELAGRGAGHVHPNAMVGAVVVDGDTVVGEGWHQTFGGPHAEVHALDAAGARARGATVYVSLEPCCHQGKTPPCTDALVAAGVGRVVVATLDPNPAVAGGGVARLEGAGIAVSVGVREDDARRLNAGFFTYHRLGRPRVTVKVATTLDGRIAASGGESKWITSEGSRAEAHRLRSIMDAVMVGRRTVERDDPALTVRHVEGRNPTRVVVDSRGRLDRDRRMFTDGEARTLHVTLPESPSNGGEQWIVPDGEDGRPDVGELLRRGGREGWRDVLVEGGADLITSCLRADLVDGLILFTAPRVLGSGHSLSWAGDLGPSTIEGARRFRLRETRQIDGDLLTVFDAER